MLILSIKVQDSEPLKLETKNVDEAKRLVDNIIVAHVNLVDLGLAAPIENIELLEYCDGNWKSWMGTYDGQLITFAEVIRRSWWRQNKNE